MKRAIDAVYENGLFRPLLHGGEIALSDGQHVRLTVDDQSEPEAIRLAIGVYEGLADEDVDEVERIALDRGNFFKVGNGE